MTTDRKTMLVLAGVCLGVNLTLAILIFANRPEYLKDYRLADNPDARHYVLLGRNVFLNGNYSRCEQPPYVPDMFRTPVYPLFAGALDLVGGAAAIYMAQAILQTIACLLLFVLVRGIFGNAAATSAAGLLAVDPLLACYNFQPMSEMLFLVLLLGSMVLVLPVILAPGRAPGGLGRRLIVGAVLLSLTILTRPAGMYLPFVLAAACLGVGWSHGFGLQALRTTMLLLLVSLAPAAAWAARNAVVFGVPRLSNVDAIVRVYFFGAGAYQVRHGISLEEAQQAISEEYGITPSPAAHNPHACELDVKAVDAEMRAAAPRVLAKYPRDLLCASAIGLLKAGVAHPGAELAAMLGRQWYAPGTSSLLLHPGVALRSLARNGPALSIVFLWQLAEVAAGVGFATIGILWAVKKREMRAAAVTLLLVLAYFCLVAATQGYEACDRMRIPALPWLYAFAGCGIGLLFPARIEERDAAGI
jgi:hypothetical protein